MDGAEGCVHAWAWPARVRRGAPAPFALVSLIRTGMVHVEVVELTRRAVAAEALRLRRDPGALQQIAQRLEVLRHHLLLDAVGAEPGHLALHVDHGLLD